VLEQKQKRKELLLPKKELERLILLENEFPRSYQTIAEIEKELGDVQEDDSWFMATEYIYECLKNSPLCLDYVNARSPFNDTVLPAQPIRYENLRIAIEKLRLIAKSSLYILSGFAAIREALNASVYFHVENGRAIFQGTDLYMEAIQNSLLDRIRRCINCGKVFYSLRIDKLTCSGKCNNVIRQRKFYKNLSEDGREKINERRRENYEYKKTLKKDS